MTDYDDTERWERDDAQAEALALRDEPLGGERVEPMQLDYHDCLACEELIPIMCALWAKGYQASLETQMGGGVHAIHVHFGPGSYALLNTEGFTFYDDTRSDVDGYDDKGYRDEAFDLDDPPNPTQIAILFDLRATQEGLVIR